MDMANLNPAVILLVVVSLALAPFVAVMVTSFTKIVVVLSLLRNALGLQQVPPNVVINGLAIVLSIYVMNPVIQEVCTATGASICPASAPAPAAAGPVSTTVSTPGDPGDQQTGGSGVSSNPASARFGDVNVGGATPPPVAVARPGGGGAAGNKLTVQDMLRLFDAGKEPLRRFLIRHSHDAERGFFLRSAQRLLPPDQRHTISAEDFIIVIPAFTVSELTAAFQIGFLIFLPFLIIDLVVANILLALGMMMLSPTTISLPFKVLLFVMIDGWAKLVHGLVLTYGT